uniref:Centromere protein J C-terminal domain-containing protein n=1 Tax=Lepisosteus oculatus TaxID=7918 RepID=W5NFG0_LEPOC
MYSTERFRDENIPEKDVVQPRNLSPIKEESGEQQGEEPRLVSPFGIKRRCSVNPEDRIRPIRPGVGVRQKTFEAFVEEQLKLDEEVLQRDKQELKPAKETEKKTFLKKGEGITRIEKSKETVLKDQRRGPLNQVLKRVSLVSQHRRSLPLLQDTDKSCERMDLQKHMCLAENDDHLDTPKKINLPQEEQHPESITSALRAQLICTDQQYSNNNHQVDKTGSNLGFKKVDDHIVKVFNGPVLSNDSGSEKSENQEKSKKGREVQTCSTKIKFPPSSTSDSTSNEDDPKSQFHEQHIHQTPLRLGHTDQKLDLSDDDYASDAPSGAEERVCRPQTPHRLPFSHPFSSTSSSDNSETEIRDFNCTQASHAASLFLQEVISASQLTKYSIGYAKALKIVHVSIQTCNYFNEEGFLLNLNILTPQQLKEQMRALQEEFKQRESHWSAAHRQLKSQVEALTRENVDLRDELRVSERHQQETWWSHHTTAQCTTKAETPVRAHCRLLKILNIHKTNETNAQLCSLGVSRCRGRQVSVMGYQSRSVTPSGRKEDQTQHYPENLHIHKVITKGSDDEVREETHFPDGKTVQLFSSGHRIITFRNGTKKEISADGKSVTVTFFNGDIKQILPVGKVKQKIYFYADAQTTHTTYPNGLEVVQFPNNQIEKHHPNGTKEIVFPDKAVKHLYPDGREESIFPD